MAWNYEKGCEESVAYTVLGRGPVTPPPGFVTDTITGGKNLEAVQMAVHKWQNNESWLKSGKWKNNPEHGQRETLKSWRQAEMAIADWLKKGDTEKFRSGYLEWLAKGNQVADDLGLTEVEIEKLPAIERIIAKGYRELAKEAHPDTGGTPEKFRELRGAKLQLDRMLSEVGELLRENV